MWRADVALAIAASVLALGCEEETPPLGSDRDPMAPVSLWPLPNTGGPTPAVQGSAGAGGAAAVSNAATFDADAIYVVGQLGEPCLSKAIMDLDAPDRLLVGIDCSAKEQTAMIRPDQNRLVYVDGRRFDVRSFRCDGCMYTLTDAQFFPTRLGGADPMATDLGCSIVDDLIVGPDARIGVKCSGDWRLPIGGSAGRRRIGSDVLALGPSDSALTDLGIVQADGTLVRFTLPAGVSGVPRPRVARARGDGYRAVFERMEALADLYDVALDGTAVHIGTYPPIPRSVQPAAPASAVLDTEGRLVELMENDRVVRRSVAGESEILYEPKMAPQFSPGALATGP